MPCFADSWAAAATADTRSAAPPPVVSGTLVVDGRAGAGLPVGRPYVVQWYAADGAVRLRLRGREVYRLPPMPDWDRPAAVAIAPFGTEIVVHEVEIVGRLDEAWISARALAVATLESNMLPAPTVPGR